MTFQVSLIPMNPVTDHHFVCFPCGFTLHLIGGYTTEMSKSNQSVHGFMTLTAMLTITNGCDRRDELILFHFK